MGEEPWPGIYDLDPILISLLDIMGRHGWSMDITLLVDGVYVSGTPVTQREYLLALGGLISEHAPTTEDSQTIRAQFMRLANRLESQAIDSTAVIEDAARDPDEEDREQRPRAYIHLKNVTLLGDADIRKLPYWRGRVIKVSAWFPGRVSPATP